MALRLINKNELSLVGSCWKFLEGRATSNVESLSRFSDAHHDTHLSNVSADEKSTNKANEDAAGPYTIHTQTRTTPVDSPKTWSYPFIPESEMLKRNQHDQFLQPSTLPTYYEKPVYSPHFLGLHQNNSNSMQKTEDTKAVSDLLGESKTRQSVTLPLKAPKLSNPFPDPIKVAISPYVVSDEEKASQALEEARMAKMTMASNISKRDLHTINVSSIFRRCYSTRKCDEPSKKKKSCVQEDPAVCRKKRPCFRKCDKIKIKGCPDVRNPLTCKLPNLEVHCHKQEAPYPSFSEKCKVDPAPSLSECVNCPWNRRKNPNFKGKIQSSTYSTKARVLQSSCKDSAHFGSAQSRLLSTSGLDQTYLEEEPLSKKKSRLYVSSDTKFMDLENVKWISMANICQVYRKESAPSPPPYIFKMNIENSMEDSFNENFGNENILKYDDKNSKSQQFEPRIIKDPEDPPVIAVSQPSISKNNEINADLLNANLSDGKKHKDSLELKVDSGMLNTRLNQEEQSSTLALKVDKSFSDAVVNKPKKDLVRKIHKLDSFYDLFEEDINQLRKSVSDFLAKTRKSSAMPFVGNEFKVDDSFLYSAPSDPSCDKQGCFGVKIDKKKCPKFPLKKCDGAPLPLNQDYLAPLRRRIARNKRDGTHCNQFSSTEAFETFAKPSQTILPNESMLLTSQNSGSKGPQERQSPAYPRDCLRDFEDKTKICPSDIDKKKTKKDRLKRKKTLPFLPEALIPNKLMEYWKSI